MEGQKLGLDVDYMAERKLLPIMHVTGGVAEDWNRRNPQQKMQHGCWKVGVCFFWGVFVFVMFLVVDSFGSLIEI